MLKDIKNNLQELGLKPNEIIIYISLTQLGESTAAKIAKKSDLPRTTAISILEKLKMEGYLTSHKYRGSNYYWIESPTILENILENKISIAKQLKNQLSDLYRSENRFPIGEIYDTKSGIKKFIEKIVNNLEKKSTIYTIDTPQAGNYSKIYSNNIENIIIAQKKKREIKTKTLIPFDSLKNIPSNKLKNQNIEIRELPAGIEFQASLWIIKDMLVHFSGQPPFIALIKHEKIIPGMTSIFHFLWTISKKID